MHWRAAVGLLLLLLAIPATLQPLHAAPPVPAGLARLARTARGAGLRPAVLQKALRARTSALGRGLGARYFSNRPGSLQSSLGPFVTVVFAYYPS